ncbi:MAG: permease [Planctomycetes bacterium]|nr:permease [Planctomycetota bacterium]
MPIFSFNLSDFVFVWWALLYEAIPFVVLGSLVSGVVARCVSREAVTRVLPRSRLLGIAASAFLGLILPMCECGIVPVIRRLVAKGVPVSCAVAYMLAAPIINPIVIGSTVLAFGGQNPATVAGLRVGMAFVVATGLGILVWRLLGESNVLVRRDDGEHEHAAHDHHGHEGGVLGDTLRIASDDFLEIGTFLVLGAAIAAFINSGFSRAAMEPFAQNPFAAVPSMMVLAILLNLCSEADAFVAASFYAFPMAAKLAFLVLGPMVDMKLMAMYTTMFRPKAIVAIAGMVIVLVFLLCTTGYVWMPLVTPGGR